MSRLVADLLTLDRLDAGRGLSLGPVDINGLIREVFDEARVMAKGQRVHLTENGACIIQGDRDRLKQAVLNLVDNALRHTPKAGSVNLEVDAREGIWHISVSDTGEGILPEHLPHIFDRFYRADRSRSRQTGSSGLGLAIVKGIVEAHHGKVEVASSVGQGSTFTIYLPL